MSNEFTHLNLWERTRAGIGVSFALFWIGILIVAACLAPFLANTAPLFIIKNNNWFFPAFELLKFVDILFIILLVNISIFYFFRSKINKLFSWLVLSVSGLLLFLAYIFINPLQLINYAKYRSLEYNSGIQFKIAAPIQFSPTDYLRDYGNTSLEAPLDQPTSDLQINIKSKDRIHLFGTDENGADVLSRMIHASRIALTIGIIATSIAMLIGIVIGGLMGYFSSWLDILGMRLVEIFESIPTLFLLLTFVAFFGRNLYIMMVIIGITSWSGYARYTRAEFLKLRKMEYVQAAIVSGIPLRSILFRHMLPNGVAPLLVAMSFGVASAILAEATLSFLGLGLVDAPSWGQMLNQAVNSATFNWWMALFPGGAIFFTVFTYTLLGEAFRDAIDPQILHKNN